jgi:hypothetical protein
MSGNSKPYQHDPSVPRFGTEEGDRAEVEAAIGEYTEQELSSVSLDAEQISAAAREDLNMLALLCMPDVFKYLFPPVFMAVWSWLLSYVHKERVFPRLALGLPRGFGKTAVIKLFVLYCIFFTGKRYIVLYCATVEKAQNILADVEHCLNNDTVKSVFGDWTAGLEKNTQNLKKFYFRGRPIVLQAAGVGTDIRGANIYGARPDVQIFDDIQKRENAESEVETAALKTWFYDTAIKTRSPFGCMYLFLGNMYATKYSLLRELARNPTWIKFITGAILDTGESLWEELYPLAQILDEYETDVAAGRKASFLAEIMNDETITASAQIDTGLIPQNKFQLEVLHQGNFVIIDPATARSGSDATGIGYCEIFDGTPVFKKVMHERMSPGQTIKNALTMCMENDCRVIFVEGNAYQSTLLYWFGVVCEELRLDGFTFEPIFSGSASKNSRILGMLPALLAGEIFMDDGIVRDLCISQIQQFNPAARKNVDELLDLLCYMIRITAEYGEFLATLSILGRQQIQDIPVRGVLETTTF